ncbi:HAD hydrolase family protein [Halosegnis sp.]|uniref:HAD hydrolase family protein n=1 Tax=Halosegnis sp. TaxID=2864959 RepID=UPI0035D3FEC9
MRPLIVDIDGTLTQPEGGLDPRVCDALRAYAEEAPVIIATGKAFPFPVALCGFLSVPRRVVAENGGVTLCERTPGGEYGGGDAEGIVYNGDPAAAAATADDYRAAGHDLGWGQPDLVNYWRETEVAVARDRPLGPLEECAAAHGQEVIDTGYAYHVKSPNVDKATGLASAAERLGRESKEFLAIGDSENDAAAFAVASESYAVANADETAKAAADHVTDAGYADGFLEALERANAR